MAVLCEASIGVVINARDLVSGIDADDGLLLVWDLGKGGHDGEAIDSTKPRIER